MDYKIWIVLLGIVLLILYLIKEMYFIKFDLINYINTLKNNNEDNNLIVRKNFQNDLNVFANKIKLLNDENLQQFRKITLLNNQPILKNNNYFREMENTDSELDNRDLRYLSDSKLMSKKESSSKFSETSELTSTETSVESSEKNIKKNRKEQNILPLRNTVVKNVLNNIISTNTLSENKINTDDLTLNKKSETTIEVNTNVIEEEKEVKEVKEVEKNISEKGENENKSLSSFRNEDNNKLDYILESDSDSESVSETNSDLADNEEEIESSDNDEEIESSDNEEESESNEIIFDKDDLELKNNYFSNKINNKELVENAENIKFDTITLGTKKSKNKKDKEEKNDLNEIKMPDEIARNVNKENLKSIDDYTLETLKNLAKKFNIPLSIKSSGKWKSLNKTEIYSEISKLLNKKNLN